MKKRDKFVELAEKRMQKALHAIRLIGNLSNKNNYEYTDSDVKKIIVSLESSIKSVKKRFEDQSSSNPFDFKL